jgi:cytochrome c-type biogenesis protein CcmF
MEPHNHLVSPPDWSLSIGSAGRGFVLLAITLFALAAIGWLLAPKYERLVSAAARCFTAGCISLFATFLSLATLFVTSRMEFVYVADHADTSNSLPYRIAGIWAGQQGSFLLWAVCAAVFGLLAVRGTGVLRRWFTITYAGFLAALASILAYETPFGLLTQNGVPFVPQNGAGLTPSLQNYWVTIHPPTIFMGFGSLTVLAAYAFAAMATNKIDIWAAMVRPWALISLTLTGVGLCMGGFWAYETLGWGGFWMWDPVENVSFVPWIFTAAFIHGLMVQITKKKWRISNLLLGGLPFLLFVYGTFLTRSGVLSETSVHSFANMDGSALKLLLGFLVISSATYLGLWAWRSIKVRKEATPQADEPRGINREGLYRLGALLMVALGLGAAIGMSWPMFMAMAGQRPKVVEEALYHKTLSWLYVPLMFAMALGPLVAWRAMGMRELMKRIYGVFCVTVAVVGLMMVVVGKSTWTRTMPPEDRIKLPFGLQMGVMPWVLILVTLSAAVIVANLWRISELIRRSKMSAAAFLAHVGVAVIMAGLIISRGYEQRVQIQVKEGTHDVGLGYVVSYKKTTSTAFDRDNKVLFDVQGANDHFVASPGLYYVDGGQEGLRPMVWPHIESKPFYDIYFALQPPTNEIGVETPIKVGVPTKVNGIQVTLEKIVRVGDPGKTGTKWGAQLRFSDGHAGKVVTPMMEITPNGMLDHPALLDDDVMVSMKGMQAGADTVSIQLLSPQPIFPVEMFFKPMTILVWGGTAIMMLAGFLSAFYRRMPRANKASLAADLLESPPIPKLMAPGREKVTAKMRV